jgi:hypothetical protein
MFTKEEVKAAKATRDAIIEENISELKSIYMAGEIVMWDECEQKNLHKAHVSGQLEAISKDFRLWYYAQSQPLSAVDIESWFASNLR